jgi:hypothetical protein
MEKANDRFVEDNNVECSIGLICNNCGECGKYCTITKSKPAAGRGES